jgi:hypothetical protein
MRNIKVVFKEHQASVQVRRALQSTGWPLGV